MRHLLSVAGHGPVGDFARTLSDHNHPKDGLFLLDDHEPLDPAGARRTFSVRSRLTSSVLSWPLAWTNNA